MRSFGIFVLALLAVPHLTTSFQIECIHLIDYWDPILKIIYISQVDKGLTITSREDSTITSVKGRHNTGQSNDGVEVLEMSKKTAYYFPQGLEKIYKNLIGIRIVSCHLKEVTPDDLSKFPLLKDLNLSGNDIEVLGEGLFNNNPDLKFIRLNNNKISKISPNIFDNLSKLVNLQLKSNTCISKTTSSGELKVEEIIQEVKENC